ncbi:MAG: type II toxin-antitoxin system PemK/MazF family toxin, partial [Candidatus Omnitrophica bacterium]|nr:type II toxin-antitoxin system PemK/MazF family toxin [Candidatus Omnitrophota bacterium]
MRRGEVWWAEQPKPIGRRPVVLLSRDEAYEVRNAVTVAQVTTTIRNIPVEVFLDKKDGLPQKCVVNLDTITTIRKSILTKRICLLT